MRLGDKGGAGIFDLEYTNMLTTLTQFVNNFTRKQFENGIDKGYKILPLGKIQSDHYKVSFYGDSAFLTKHHGQYVQSQYTLREFAYNQKKATQTNPYATYSSSLTSLGQRRRVGGFELVAQKTAENRGDLYSSSQIVWGLEPYNLDDSMPGVGGALVLTKKFQPGSENDVLSNEFMQYYTNQRYLQYRVFKGVVAFGQTPGGMGRHWSHPTQHRPEVRPLPLPPVAMAQSCYHHLVGMRSVSWTMRTPLPTFLVRRGNTRIHTSHCSLDL